MQKGVGEGGGSSVVLQHLTWHTIIISLTINHFISVLLLIIFKKINNQMSNPSVPYCFRYESWRLEVVDVEIMEVQDKLCICYSILITFITMLAGAGPGEKNMLNAKHETTLIFIKNCDHLGKHKSGKTSPNCVSMLIWRTFTWFWDIWLVGWIHSRWLFYFCLPRYSFESLDGVGAVDLSNFQVASAQPGDVTVSRAIFNSF